MKKMTWIKPILVRYTVITLAFIVALITINALRIMVDRSFAPVSQDIAVHQLDDSNKAFQQMAALDAGRKAIDDIFNIILTVLVFCICGTPIICFWQIVNYRKKSFEELKGKED